jgi:hypothetical protein
MLSFLCKAPNGQVVRLDDLPVEDIQNIATECGMESWFDLYLQPARYGRATVALYRHCCKVVDAEPVEPVTPKVILSAFEAADDNLPTLWEDGNPPTADDPTTP